MTNTIQRLSAAIPNQIIIEKIIYGNQGVHPEGDFGQDSYFDIVIQDNSKSGLLNGKFDGFCIDTDRPIDFELDNDLNGVIDNNEVGTSYNAKVYSSYDFDGLQNAGLLGNDVIEKPENLDSVNWLINNFANGSIGNIQGVNFADVQRAIWTLIDNENASVFLTDFSGNPLWNDTRVNSIVNLAETQGEGFVPEFGQKMAIILVPDDNNDGLPDAQVVVAAVELSKLGDKVFLDNNADGIQDSEEVGIENVKVNLLADIDGDGVIGDDEIIDSTFTDENGEYHFTVIAGDYKVSFEQPENFEVSPANQGNDDIVDSDGLISEVISLAPGEANPTIDNGFFQKAALGNFVWEDKNANGIQDVDELGVEGVTATLTGGGVDGVIGTNDDTTATTITNANGFYQFTELNPGEEYKVTFSNLPNGFEFTSSNVGSDDTVDSDADVNNGMTQTVTLSSSEFNDTLDAGIFQKASLGNFVWEDKNANGIQDVDELCVEGVTTTLTGGGADGVIGTNDDTTATTITNANGFYQFTELNPGEEYKVTFSNLPNGFEFTSSNVGSDDTVDSDADVNNGMTQTVTLSSSEFNDTLDAGLIKLNPGIEIKKFVNGEDADKLEDAVEVAPGEDVTFTYEVTNTGNVAFAASEVILKDDNGTPDNINDDFNPDYVIGDNNNNNFLDPNETWLYSETQVAQNLSTITTTVIDFETDGAGNLLFAGDVIDTEYQNLGLTVSATKFGAMIFDSANPTGGDSDLSIPGLNNILIISEDGDSNDPDDNARGGTITFDLDNPVNIQSIDLVDIEEKGGTVVTTNANGDVTSTPIDNPGDNTLQTLIIDDSNVTKVEVNLVGSGAISGLEYNTIGNGLYKNIGTVSINDLVDSDPAHYINPTPEPGIDIEKFVNGIDAKDVSEFPALTPGDHVTFTYEVTNTGNVAFARNEVVVRDDNGTANNNSDDFNPNYVSGDNNSNNILDPNETWNYSATNTVQNLTHPIYEDTTFVFKGHTPLDGHNGNVRTFTVNDVTVDVSAFSRQKYSGNWNEAYVGVYDGGLGVTNTHEDTYAHRVDNRGSVDYLIFEFDTDVVVDKALLKSVGHDSDLSLWIGNRDGANLDSLDDDLLYSYHKENNFTHHGSSREADLNDRQLAGDTLILSAFVYDSKVDSKNLSTYTRNNDSFKLHTLDVVALTGSNSDVYQNIATVDTGLVSDSDFSGYVNDIV